MADDQLMDLLRQGADAAAGGLSDVARTSLGLAGNLLSGSQKLSDYGEAIDANTKLFGALGKTVNGLIKFAESSLEEYQTLSGIGASFGKEMQNIKVTAAELGLTVEEMTELFQNNMDSLSAFGGTTNDAIARFRDFSSSVLDSEVGSRLRRLGYTVSDINDTLMLYQEIAMQDGNATRLSEQQRQQSAENLAVELDRLSKLTGKQREQIADEMRERRRQGDIQAFLMGRSAEEQQAYMENLAEIEATLGKDAADLFVDLSVRGAPTTEATRNAMLALGPAAEELASGAQAFSTGNLSAFDSSIQSATSSAVDYLQTEEARQVAMLGDMNTVSGAYADMYESMYGFMNRVEGAAQEGEDAASALQRMNMDIAAEQSTQMVEQTNNLLDQTINMQESVREFVIEVQRSALDNLETMATEAINAVQSVIPDADTLAAEVGSAVDRLFNTAEDTLFNEPVSGASFLNPFFDLSGEELTPGDIAGGASAEEIGNEVREGAAEGSREGAAEAAESASETTIADGDETRSVVDEAVSSAIDAGSADAEETRGTVNERSAELDAQIVEAEETTERLSGQLQEAIDSGVIPDIAENARLLEEAQASLDSLREEQAALAASVESSMNAALSAAQSDDDYAGPFAEGGRIPAGEFGLVGEAGPEFISGPADVISTRNTRSIIDLMNTMSSINRQPDFVPETPRQTQAQEQTNNISNNNEMSQLINMLGSNFKDMNNVLNQMLRIESEIAETTNRQYKATRGLSGNLIKGIGA